jgi:undecaprenyl-phosphate 4-deoxy-4-formamido-L-arabinose transferase
METNSWAFEIVFVEDCGGDNSWRVIKNLSDQDDRVIGIRLSRNYGQHNALLCGIREAQGKVIVTLDDDLQNPPEEIPKLLAELDKGYDVVYGYPQAQTHGFLRNMASRVTKLALMSAMGAETASRASAFRAFKGYLKESFADYRSPAVNIEVLLTWGTTNFGHVLVRQDERAMGESGYTVKKLVVHAVNMATGFSTLPLQFASVLGIIFSLIGVVILAYVLIRYLTADSVVPGFSFIASMVAIFSGAQLFCIGIIGEYLARMHSRTMERPAYNVFEHASKNLEANNH